MCISVFMVKKWVKEDSAFNLGHEIHILKKTHF